MLFKSVNYSLRQSTGTRQASPGRRQQKHKTGQHRTAHAASKEQCCLQAIARRLQCSFKLSVCNCCRFCSVWMHKMKHQKSTVVGAGAGCEVLGAGCGVWCKVIRCVHVHHSCNIWSWNVEGFRSWLLLWYFIMEFDPFANLAMGQICQPCNPSFDAEGASRSQSAAGTALSVCARLITQLI